MKIVSFAVLELERLKHNRFTCKKFKRERPCQKWYVIYKIKIDVMPLKEFPFSPRLQHFLSFKLIFKLNWILKLRWNKWQVYYFLIISIQWYHSTEKESDKLLYTVRSLVTVREGVNSLHVPRSIFKTEEWISIIQKIYLC